MVNTIWVLCDQLSSNNSALLKGDKKHDVLFMVESSRALGKLPYHKHRLILLLSASRHFAEERRREGWTVDYYELTPEMTWEKALALHTQKHAPHKILLSEPNNYDEQMASEKLAKKFAIERIPTNQFLIPRENFLKWAAGKKSLLMESHYRRVRQELGFLMDKKGEPIGGQWNFDEENRKTYKDWQKSSKPKRKEPSFTLDSITREVISVVEKAYPNNPGDGSYFWLPVTRKSSLKWLEDFIEQRLSHFGPWEDLMLEEDRFLFHSVLSPALNIGLLTPKECIEKAISAYDRGLAPINSVEGFVRQIAGWREFVNGVYWLKMPEYESSNGLEANRPLPDFFYSGDTDLYCLKKTLSQVHETGFNHHIQRLMVLGNFLLISGVRPQEALRWFNEMYVDAHDWVMAANVLGMVLHADGGFMATKPYAAGSGYISRMSNYCSNCRYKPEIKTGEQACPFNYLYWDFYSRHTKRFSKNPRVSMAISTWNKKSPDEKRAISQSAQEFMTSIQRKTKKSPE